MILISEDEVELIQEVRSDVLEFLKDSKMSLAEALGILRVSQFDIRDGKIPSSVKNTKRRKKIYKKLDKKDISQSMKIGILETLISDVFSLQKQKVQQQSKSDKGTIADPTM